MTDINSEETPLLGDDQRVNPANVNVDNDDAVFAAHRRRVIAVTFAMIILVDFAAFFLDAPQTSILEKAICSRYYGPDGAGGAHDDLHGSSTSIGDPPPDCTVGPVQAELATVTQMLNTFNRIPGFFVVIPLGVAADRYGRRPVLFLTFFGALLQDLIAKVILWRPGVFTPRLIWLSSLAGFVGGSNTVATAIVFLVVADVAPPQRRAELFFTMIACERIGEIVGTPLSTLLMYNFGPWVPYILSTVLTMVGFLGVFAFMPETLRPKPIMPESTHAEANETATEPGARIGDGIDEAQQTLKKQGSFVAKFRPLLSRNVIAVVIAFFVSSLGRQSTSFFLQYIHQRFNWTYEKASLPMV
ncbi:hypothetical protein SCUCBS95973_000254 [Sporothrix curviconia]|uniref:Major facilitator superfamily (MFS) profile domain-containing protein n=1 Tax=Sporothrix curviconia TaxID=1260050 RepID=A0ABP0ANP3_9PEZI